LGASELAKDDDTNIQEGNSMPKGRVDIRKSQRDGKHRLRFYGADDDQLETILLALERCRAESNTEYDLVALERLAMHYLSFK
jgi:hypothetical protein